MATFREMSTEIQNELGADGGNDLSDETDAAINRAIALFEHEAFALTYGQNTELTAVVNDPDYTLPDAVQSVDAVQYLFSDYEYPLTQQTYEWYLDIVSQQTSQTGPSTHFVIYGRTLFLYPAPSEANQITISGNLRPTPAPFVTTTNDDDENFWTDERGAFQLIKAATKWDLLHNNLNDPINAATEQDRVKIFLNRLRGRVENTMMVGRHIPKHWF